MKTIPVSIKAKVWLYPGDAAWHFITVPLNESETLKEMFIWPRRGFGAIPVNVTVGSTNWKTSIFPQKAGTFLLPIKKEIRKVEGVYEGDLVKITVEVIN